MDSIKVNKIFEEYIQKNPVRNASDDFGEMQV